MSLEQSIADLTRQAGLLIDLPQQVSNAAQNQIAAIGASYAATMAGMTRTFWLNPATGSDTNSGTAQSSPYKTLQRCIDQTPRGGFVNVILDGDLAIMGQRATIEDRRVLITGNGVRKNLSFERLVNASVTPNQRDLAGFALRGTASLGFVNCRFNLPALDGGWGGYAAFGTECLFFTPGEQAGFKAVSMISCEIVTPATAFGALFPDGAPVSLMVWNLTVVGPALNGRVHSSFTSTAGVAAASVSQISTNLATI